MRLIMVRHGEPDYSNDCLTPEGRLQAAAAAERLETEGISEIYSSPMGRARETASFTADRLGLPVTVLDFMHEISWGGPGVPENGHPWTLSERMIADEDFDFFSSSWRDHPYYRANVATEYFDLVSARFDAFLSARGYVRDGSRFRCVQANDRTIALFSHGGSGACVLASLLSLPFPYVATVMPYDFTSIIILDFPSLPGQHVFPRLALFNDIAHLRRVSRPAFQQTPD